MQLMVFLVYGAISLYIDCACDIYLIMLQHPSEMISNICGPIQPKKMMPEAEHWL